MVFKTALISLSLNLMSFRSLNKSAMKVTSYIKLRFDSFLPSRSKPFPSHATSQNISSNIQLNGIGEREGGHLDGHPLKYGPILLLLILLFRPEYILFIILFYMPSTPWYCRALAIYSYLAESDALL